MATAAVGLGTLRASAEFQLYPNQGAGAGAAVGAKVRSYLDEGADAGAGAEVLSMLNLALSAWESPSSIARAATRELAAATAAEAHAQAHAREATAAAPRSRGALALALTASALTSETDAAEHAANAASTGLGADVGVRRR